MGYLESGLEEMLSFLENEKDFYNNLIDRSLPGGLICMRRGGATTYLHSVPVSHENGTRYYSKRTISKDPDTIRALATNAYAKEALNINAYNIKQIKDAQEKIRKLTQDTVIGGLKKAYRELPEEYYSHIKTEGIMERYREWMSTPFVQSSYKPEHKKFDTGRGIRVRSKGEMMLVEKFFQYGVPFHYEEVLMVGEYELAPDFTFPSRSGKKFYLEYCGMMDDPNYVYRYLWKRKLYEGIGITEWNNMIYVFDSNNNMDMNRVDSVIRTMILPRL